MSITEEILLELQRKKRFVWWRKHIFDILLLALASWFIYLWHEIQQERLRLQVAQINFARELHFQSLICPRCGIQAQKVPYENPSDR